MREADILAIDLSVQTAVILLKNIFEFTFN